MSLYFIKKRVAVDQTESEHTRKFRKALVTEPTAQLNSPYLEPKVVEADGDSFAGFGNLESRCLTNSPLFMMNDGVLPDSILLTSYLPGPPIDPAFTEMLPRSISPIIPIPNPFKNPSEQKLLNDMGNPNIPTFHTKLVEKAPPLPVPRQQLSSIVASSTTTSQKEKIAMKKLHNPPVVYFGAEVLLNLGSMDDLGSICIAIHNLFAPAYKKRDGELQVQIDLISKEGQFLLKIPQITLEQKLRVAFFAKNLCELNKYLKNKGLENLSVNSPLLNSQTNPPREKVAPQALPQHPRVQEFLTSNGDKLSRPAYKYELKSSPGILVIHNFSKSGSEKRQLGSGAFGRVRRAQFLPDKPNQAPQPLAVKKEHIKPSALAAHLVTEAIHHQAATSCPFVLKPIGGFFYSPTARKKNTRNHIKVLPLVKDGLTFKDKLKKLSPFRRLQLTYHMALAIHTLHRMDVIHGDLKDANFLFVKEKNKFKLLLSDFGFSQPVSLKGSYLGIWNGIIGGSLYSPTSAAISERSKNKTDLTKDEMFSIDIFPFAFILLKVLGVNISPTVHRNASRNKAAFRCFLTKIDKKFVFEKMDKLKDLKDCPKVKEAVWDLIEGLIHRGESMEFAVNHLAYKYLFGRA